MAIPSKTLRAFALAALGLAALAPAQAAGGPPVLTVADTGEAFTSQGAATAATKGTAAPNFTLTFLPQNAQRGALPTPEPVFVVSKTDVTWTAGLLAAPAAPSQWIAPHANELLRSEAPGTYIYETTFTVDNSLALNSLSLSGKFAADDSARILLNGADTGVSTRFGQLAFTPFTISDNAGTAPFQIGVNTLDFVVTNKPLLGFGTPTGLRTADMALTGSPAIAPAPEPSAVAGMVVGLLGLGALALRAQRRTSAC